MNNFLSSLKNETNYDYTENGAITHKHTDSAILDMFAVGGAYRNRSDDDCIWLFKRALDENETLALKCLFYLRDCRGGQGERRFFRVCFSWLADARSDLARRNLINISEYGRWDDLIYSCLDTSLEKNAFSIIRKQLMLDMQCKTPSLLAKWMPSENASSYKTKAAAAKLRNYLGLSHKEYRLMLSELRARINVLERLMSANEWDKIEFDKIPSKAGLLYKNAFARRDIIAKKYETFVKSNSTKVNADVLNPVDIAHEAFYANRKDNVDRAALQKYWDNLKDYYNGREENGIAIIDTSGSMWGQPLEAAVSMGAYIAERGHGPFANHFITFSAYPDLIEFKGVDIVDKFQRAGQANWGGNTNIEAVFDLMLQTALKNHTSLEDMPQTLYIFSDMEFDSCITSGESYEEAWGYYRYKLLRGENAINTLFENISKKWDSYGYKLPRVIFWNLDCRNGINIPAFGKKFSYVSGFNMNMVETILGGKDGYDLMIEKLMSERYAIIK